MRGVKMGFLALLARGRVILSLVLKSNLINLCKVVHLKHVSNQTQLDI